MFGNNRGWILSLYSLQFPSISLIECLCKSETNLVIMDVLFFYCLDGNDLVASDLSSVHPMLLLNMHLIRRFSFHWGSCNQIAFYHQFSLLILFNL